MNPRLAVIVDNADFVMRFNEPNLSGGMSGMRTDMLVLAVSSKSLHRRLADPAFLDAPAVKAAKVAMLAYHPQVSPATEHLSAYGRQKG